MRQRIKLENSHGVVHDRQTGEPVIDITVEYVCEHCRELVNETDKYCWKCGEELQDTGLVEHHVGGGQINHSHFQQMKALPAKDIEAFLDSVIPNRRDKTALRAQIKQEELDRANAAPHVRIGDD